MPINPEQPIVYVIAGPNGAGKTTFATSFLPGFVNCREFVNADLIAAGLSPFDPDSQAVTAGRLMLQRIDSLVQEKETFGFETTLAGRTHARRLASMKSGTGYRVVLFFLWLESEALAISRVASRVREGGHDIPTETVRRRFQLGIRNFTKLYRNLADDWYIIDGSKATPSISCRGSSDGVEVIDQERLNYIRSISPELLR
jgi:predicted ABC-type ATPase